MAGHTSYNELRKQLSPEQRKRSTKKVEAMKIGLLVRQQREKAGLTQTQLGAQTGMSQQAISQIEWGEEIELSTLQKIFAALGGEIFVRMPDGNIPLPLTPSATADLSHPV